MEIKMDLDGNKRIWMEIKMDLDGNKRIWMEIKMTKAIDGNVHQIPPTYDTDISNIICLY